MLFRASPAQRARRARRKAFAKVSKKAASGTKKAAITSQERAAELAERAGAAGQDLAKDLTRRARGLWSDAELDKRMGDLAERLRESEAAQKAAGQTREMTDASLHAVGEWLTRSKSGKAVSKRLGVQERRRWPVLLAGLAGLAGGFALARSAERREELQAERDEIAEGAERLATTAGAAGTVMVDTVRAALSGDPRTTELRELDINVAEGTVFVRGAVPEERDREALREVIASVPGVRDVDLQLASTG